MALLAPSVFRKSADRIALDEAFVRGAIEGNRFEHLATVVAGLADPRASMPVFAFHRATPPLANVKFAELSPARSVRMDMASIFADIDGYTNFVDTAIQGGPQQIKKAVETIHVIREELNSVLKEDFGGKRVRFIGDCIHGCLALGERQDDHSETVKQAALCASGMRSSFDLCLELVQPGADIDLAVGIEIGPTPLTRIGDVGDDSVRCAASRATARAEKIQQEIEGGGVRLGEIASSFADTAVRKNYAVGALLGFDAAADLLRSPASPVVQIVRDQPAARSHAALPKEEMSVGRRAAAA
jgi:hypothetical protein